MTLVVADRVRDSTTTVGTGTVTLSGTAPSGFQNFSVIGNGNTTYYCISDQTGSDWEVGIGTYSSTGPTLARTTVLASSNAGALVTFGVGTKDVICTYAAGKMVSTDTLATPPAIGSTTANTGAFTTLDASGAVTLSGGTANGVTYLNGSKVVTTGSALTFDGTNLGVGVTPSASSTFIGGANTPILGIAKSAAYSIIQSKAYSTTASQGGILVLSKSKSATIGTQTATASGDGLGYLSFEGVNSSSGVAGSSYIAGFQDGSAGATYVPGRIAFYTSDGTNAPTERMRLDSSGRLMIGPISSTSTLSLSGAASDTWAGSGSEGLALNGNISANGITTISTYLDTSSIRIGAGVTQKTGLLITGQTSASGSTVQFSAGGATVGTFTSTGLNSAAIGATTPAAGTFTALSATSNATGSVTAKAGGLTSVTAVAGSLTLATGGVTLASQTATATAAWRVRAHGTYAAASSANARTLTMSCYWGTTALASITTGNVLASTVNTTSWEVEFTITGSSTTAVWVVGRLFSGVTAASTASPLLTSATPASTTVTAGAQTLDFRVGQTGTATSTDTINVHSVVIERIK